MDSWLCPTGHLHTFRMKHIEYSMWYYNTNIKGKTLCILLAECCEHYNILCIPENVTTDDSQKEALGKEVWERKDLIKVKVGPHREKQILIWASCTTKFTCKGHTVFKYQAA
jgi:hypothetical protein